MAFTKGLLTSIIDTKSGGIIFLKKSKVAHLNHMGPV